MARFPSGVALSDSQEEVASLTWTVGHTTGEGERERRRDNFATECLSFVSILDCYTLGICLNSPEWLGNSDMIEVRTH